MTDQPDPFAQYYGPAEPGHAPANYPQYGPQPGTEQHAGYTVSGQPYSGYEPPPAPRKRRRLRGPLLALLVIALLILAVGFTIIGVVANRTPTGHGIRSAADTTSGTALDPDYSPPPSAPAAPEVTYDTPTVNSFTPAVKILTKDCFGSYGCNITYRVQLSYAGRPLALDPDVAYEITYRVTGGSDGPQVDTTRVQGGDYDVPVEGLAQVPSRSTVLQAKVTTVEPVG